MIHDAVWSPDGRKFASCGEDGRLVIASGTGTERLIRVGGPAYAAAFSPDARHIACCFHDTELAAAPLTLGDAQTALPEDLDETLGEYIVSAEWDASPEVPEGVTLPLRIFDCSTGALLASFVPPVDVTRLTSVAWTPNGRELLACSPWDGLLVWQVRTGAVTTFETEFPAQQIALSPNGDAVALGGQGFWAIIATDGTVIEDHEAEELTSVAWSRDGTLAFGAKDGVVYVVQSGRRGVRHLEAHTRPITSVSFSSDGKLLATKSLDGTVRLWDSQSWDAISVLDEPARGQSESAPVAFSPTENKILSLGPAGKAIRTWEFEPAVLAARREVAPTTHYANAKVVLLGDQSVGKTGLGLVLAGTPWRATESTHRRNVWLIDSIEHDATQPERRETYLWDLAGQPGYRLLHQLHLSDVAVAIVVFDARDEVDPFAGVRHWVRAVRLAERDGRVTVPRLLVSARVDRGGPPVGEARIEAVLREYGFDAHIRTSAKEGEGVSELFEAIRDRIDWESMPKVSSTGLFDSIKAFLQAEQNAGLLMAPGSDLYRSYLATQDPNQPASREEFDTCVGRVAARGLIRRLSFGGMILLQPEVLDAYAAALLHAVRDQPDGLGEISEDDARLGRFTVPADERVRDPQLERLLLAATVEEVLFHEVALREHSDEGPYLVFPTQSRREAPALANTGSVYATVQFEGPVSHVYATLIVRLTHSGLFQRQNTYRNATTFRAKRAVVGVGVAEKNEAAGEITLFAEPRSDRAALSLFYDYVLAHVRRRALADTVVVDHTVRCGGCGLEVTREQRTLALQRRLNEVRCMICGDMIELTSADLSHDDNEIVIRQMDESADAERRLAAAKAALAGKVELGEFDVFLAHNSGDKEQVQELALHLREFGIHPWIDEEQIPPGRWFQDVIQRTMGDIPVAAIIVGSHGLGPWEIVELRGFISECVDRHIPVIPVLLPQAEIPRDLRFLSQFGWVRFKDSLADDEQLARLRWGITDPTDARGLSRPRQR